MNPISRTADEALSRTFHSSFKVRESHDGLTMVDTPFHFRDGDFYVVHLKPDNDGWIITDCGNSLMQLGYRVDDTLVRQEPIKTKFEQLLKDADAHEEEFELRAPATRDNLMRRVLEFCDLITAVVALEEEIRAGHKA